MDCGTKKWHEPTDWARAISEIIYFLLPRGANARLAVDPLIGEAPVCHQELFSPERFQDVVQPVGEGLATREPQLSDEERFPDETRA